MASSRSDIPASIEQIMAPKSAEHPPLARNTREGSAPLPPRQPMGSSIGSSSIQMPGGSRHSIAGDQSSLEELAWHHRTYCIYQEKLYKEQKQLWEKEREHLINTIHQLEDRLFMKKDSVNLISPTSRWNSYAGTLPPEQAPRVSNVRGTAWQGSETKPSRTSSDTTPTGSKPTGRLPSIPETSERKKNVEFDTGSLSEPRRSSAITVAGESISPDLEGINFKNLPLLLPGEKQRVTDSATESSSSLRSPSPLTSATPPPPAVEPRPKLIDVPEATLNAESLYTKDAGHTPLAHVIGDDPAASSVKVSPPGPAEIEKPPFEPAPTAKPPAELSDSYFPPARGDLKENAQEGPPDEDPALEGPLALSSAHNKAEDANFLDKVNSQLEATQLIDGPSDPGGKQGNDQGDADGDGEPKLRIKRSMNFGAPLGQGR